MSVQVLAGAIAHVCTTDRELTAMNLAILHVHVWLILHDIVHISIISIVIKQKQSVSA